MEMITVNITKSIYDEAYERNQKYLAIFGDSGTHRKNKNRQRMTGYLAEACIRHKFNNIQYNDTSDVDFRIGSITIDSKAQGCNTKPLDFYVATLYEEQKHRDADYYIFSRVKNDFTVAWICGIISKSEFMQKSTLVMAGTQNNNFTYDQNRYEIQYNQLHDIKHFIETINYETI